MKPLQLSAPRPPSTALQAGEPVVFSWDIVVREAIVFDVDGFFACLDRDGNPLWTRSLSEDGTRAPWLPRGRYQLTLMVPKGGFPEGTDRIGLSLIGKHGPSAFDVERESVQLASAPVGDGMQQARSGWSGDPDPNQLSWRRGHDDWFFRHFDHASTVVGGYLLKDSPLLRGRVLDMGCGDGITDLGLYYRYQPEVLIGIDPFSGFDRLPEIARANHLPLDPWPERLRFMREDGNHLPFEDDSFDVVVSWGSVEHIAGGYGQALREIKRVLRPDGLLFAHPGLYYSNYGHHLGEFSDEPFLHLRRSHEDLKNLVLNTPPRYMDRAGEEASNAQYWQWYNELNKITVAGFEAELRALDFEPWRVALRTEPIIEYVPEILAYPMQDLSTLEMYVSCVNRKAPRPPGFRRQSVDELMGGGKAA